MSVSTLDTHRTVKRLIEAGFSTEQAETVTDVLTETRAFDLSELATKADLRSAEVALKADIRTVEGSLRADLRTLEAALVTKIADGNKATLQWVIGLFLAQIAVIAGLIKLLAAH